MDTLGDSYILIPQDFGMIRESKTKRRCVVIHDAPPFFRWL